MKTLEESVVTAMDGSEPSLFPYLPYILQDIWEIGADPDVIIKLIKNQFNSYNHLKILDLGCGKGAVSVKAVKALGCRCLGIDAVPEFIAYAREKAAAFGADHLCVFETGDIREKVKDLSGYDIIILGAVGPVFGDYYETLMTLSKCTAENGIFIIDDGYIEDSSAYTHPLIQKRSAVFRQIDAAGMTLAEEIIIEKEDMKDSEDFIFQNLEKRCFELMEKYPEKKELFANYIRKQIEEIDVLQNKAVCSTMVIKRK